MHAFLPKCSPVASTLMMIVPNSFYVASTIPCCQCKCNIELPLNAPRAFQHHDPSQFNQYATASQQWARLAKSSSWPEKPKPLESLEPLLHLTFNVSLSLMVPCCHATLPVSVSNQETSRPRMTLEHHRNVLSCRNRIYSHSTYCSHNLAIWPMSVSNQKTSGRSEQDSPTLSKYIGISPAAGTASSVTIA